MERSRRICPKDKAGVPASAKRNAGHSGVVTMFFTYILKSNKDGKYYYGSTSNIEKRLKEHNCGRVIATKNRRPLILHYYETHDLRIDALQREMFFKKRSGYKWLKNNKII